MPDHFDPLDWIATGIVVAPVVALLALAYWSARRLGPGRRWPRAASAMLGFAILASMVWAGRENIGVGHSQYPVLLEAYDLAGPERQPAMRGLVREAVNRREIFSFALSQRDRYLHAGGYCAHWWEVACRPLPSGSEAIGIAIERFGYIARWGTSHEQQEPCDPRRCATPAMQART